MTSVVLIPAEAMARLVCERADRTVDELMAGVDVDRLVAACERGVPAVREELAAISVAVREKVLAIWQVSPEDLASLGGGSSTPANDAAPLDA